ncbi:M24 family metallopeptidase [Pseudophaeobacter flagellatus]|uniref:M24 family metallopeptidase n=1 Tax=Pseudophaeobacter flagellatus TaxID=2899119 RepID=UPI001E305489|nr:Xaa-Pro peptidase family protein [Pseudophaeobacter flagellatus]MCD9149616.1 Xaa-Pro peptidase family protein [Pseudophaeobacter flagellatus]
MLHNPPERGFAQAEFAARTQKAQALMLAQGLDGLLLLSEPEVRYFSGFHTLFWQSPTRPWFLFVPATGKPIAVIPEIGAALMRQTWVDDIRSWSAPAPQDDGITLLQELLAPLAQRRGRLGILTGHETAWRMPLADWQRLLTCLPGLELADATGLVQGLRMVKSKAEIAKLSHICAIGSATFAKVPELVAQGMPLEEAFRAFRCAGLAQGADDLPYLVGGAGPGGYVDVISPPGRRALQDGDILMLDTGASWDGYFCDFDRNFAIGSADDAARRAYDVLWRATEAGLAAARPGNSFCDLFQAMQRVIAELDQQGGDIGRLGHGLGMQLTEQPSIAAFEHSRLKPGMVLTLEPSLGYGDGLIMVHEENIVITDQGARLLSQRAAPELPVI